MKANRTARAGTAGGRRSFWDDESGVSEAVGYVLTFGISTIILITSLQAFQTIRGYTAELAMDRTVKEVAAQVQFAVEEALRANATYSDATFEMVVRIPEHVNGIGYRIEMDETRLFVNATNAARPEFDQSTNQPLPVRGRAVVTFLQSAGATVLCQNGEDTMPGGTCRVDSRAGRVTILVGVPDPSKPNDRGVYLKAE